MFFKLKNWRRDEGSIDFIQMVVGLIIIAIAAVGTLQALYYGYEQLDFQIRHRKAIAIARSHIEYLQGRLHVDLNEQNFQDLYLIAGNLTNPEEKLLDRRDPGLLTDDVMCKVMHSQIQKIDDPSTKGYDYWIIRVYVRWDEPGEPKTPTGRHFVFLDARMIPAGI